jgi:hypothetical protein
MSLDRLSAPTVLAGHLQFFSKLSEKFRCSALIRLTPTFFPIHNSVSFYYSVLCGTKINSSTSQEIPRTSRALRFVMVLATDHPPPPPQIFPSSATRIHSTPIHSLTPFLILSSLGLERDFFTSDLQKGTLHFSSPLYRVFHDLWTLLQEVIS